MSANKFMTLEEKRIKVALKLGAKVYPLHDMQDMDERRYFECSRCGAYQGWSDYSKHGFPKGPCVDDKKDYPNDLNAMHEAEKVLTGEECLRYADELNRQTKCFKHITPVIMCMASSDKRFEAFGITCGLWKEGE